MQRIDGGRRVVVPQQPRRALLPAVIAGRTAGAQRAESEVWGSVRVVLLDVARGRGYSDMGRGASDRAGDGDATCGHSPCRGVVNPHRDTAVGAHQGGGGDLDRRSGVELDAARDRAAEADAGVKVDFSISTLAAKPSFPGPGMWLHGSNRALMRRTLAGSNATG